jgi:hypothetical protein
MTNDTPSTLLPAVFGLGEDRNNGVSSSVVVDEAATKLTNEPVVDDVVTSLQKEAIMRQFEGSSDNSPTISQAPTPLSRSIQNSPQPSKRVVINCDKDETNGAATDNVEQNVEPLSWQQARAELAHMLEEYLRQPTKGNSNHLDGNVTKRMSFASLWISWDLDLFCGGFLISTSLLLISCFSLVQHRQHPNGHGSVLRASASTAIYREQVAASALLVMGFLISIWAVRRRRFSSSDDAENAKRRVIINFLKELEKISSRTSSINGEVDMAEAVNNLADAGELAGTSLTDIYPVYRWQSDTANGRWHRLPTLLMIQGDLLALQIGDMAPAECSSIGEGNAITLKAGERLRLETYGATTDSTKSQLPRGRTTLSVNAKELLTLCNRMQMFVVKETPIQSFLNRPICKGLGLLIA